MRSLQEALDALRIDRGGQYCVRALGVQMMLTAVLLLQAVSNALPVRLARRIEQADF